MELNRALTATKEAMLFTLIDILFSTQAGQPILMFLIFLSIGIKLCTLTINI